MRTLQPLLLSTLLFAAVVNASTVGEIESLPDGTAATLTSNPVITAIGSAPGAIDGYTYTNYAILAADSTGSIDLFGRLPTGSSYVPTIGDAISAAGTYSPFDAIPELGSLTAVAKVSSGNAVPSAIPVTVAQLANIDDHSFNYLGHYLSLQNAFFVGATGNFPVHANGTYTVTGASGQDSIILYQWASSYSAAGALGGTAIPTGPVNINGIVDLFNGKPEFVPFSIVPAATTATPEPAAVGLSALGLSGLGFVVRRHGRAASRVR